MKRRCPSSRFVSVAKLINHRLAFTRKSNRRGCGSADAIPAQSYILWGVIYEIEQSEITNLDEAENFVPGRAQNGYTRQQTEVFSDGEDKPVLVSIYFAEKQKNPPLPSAEYKQLIVEGAKHWKLPQEYIGELEKIRIST
jgi:gamma-glutamylcyclotransferase (GGCT)/AIG2-like uncharacterized protein YtfP